MAFLEVDGLVKVFGQGSKAVEAVRDVSFSIVEGEVYGLLGPNGAGKTTTIKMITGLVVPDAGRVFLGGREPLRNRSALRQVGAVLEGNRNLYWRLTVQENLEYFGVLRGMGRKAARAAARHWLQRFDLAGRAGTPVRKLSRGLQQRVALSVALMHEPKMVLLDEPTLGLDVESSEEVKEMIREISREGRAVLLTTHQLNVVQELADRVAIIDGGEVILEERTDELIRRHAGEACHLELETPLAPETRSQLAELGAICSDDGRVVEAVDGVIYEVLARVRPAPILRLEKKQADLAQIFLEQIRRRRNDAAVPE